MSSLRSNLASPYFARWWLYNFKTANTYSKENELVNVDDRPETEHFGFVVVVGGKVLAETELAPTVRKLER